MICLLLFAISGTSLLGLFLLDWYYSKRGYPISKIAPIHKHKFQLYIPGDQAREAQDEEELVNMDHLAHLQRKNNRHG